MKFSLVPICPAVVLCVCFASTGPAWSKQQASTSSESSSKSHRPVAHARSATPDAGSMNDGVYRNPFFGFSYKAPYGWVDRTQDMQEGSEPGKSMVLLAMFERPPEAAGDTVNSAVVIAAESVALYPGLKTATDYFAPLTELTTSKGFKVVNEPYEYSLGTKPLVRGDFSKEVGKLTMYQASLVAPQKGYILSFSFVAGSSEEVDQLVEKLVFAVPRASAAPKK